MGVLMSLLVSGFEYFAVLLKKGERLCNINSSAIRKRGTSMTMQGVSFTIRSKKKYPIKDSLFLDFRPL